MGLVAESIESIHEGRFQRSLSLITAVSALLGGFEVVFEHYRGSYNQRVMFTPVLLSIILFGAGGYAAVNPKKGGPWLRRSSVLLLLDGVAGFFYHIRGVKRKPGGWRIPIFNIIMGPPLFAPLLLGMASFLGLVAAKAKPEESRDNESKTGANRMFVKRLEHPFYGAAALSAILNGFEAAYSHYKMGYDEPTQWIPVALTPPLIAVNAAAIGNTYVRKTVLPALSVAVLISGGLGSVLHMRGIGRRSGGFRLGAYNLIYGPPAFAPLLFAATGFLGLLGSAFGRGES
jgi:hypothetical protein